MSHPPEATALATGCPPWGGASPAQPLVVFAGNRADWSLLQALCEHWHQQHPQLPWQLWLGGSLASPEEAPLRARLEGHYGAERERVLPHASHHGKALYSGPLWAQSQAHTEATNTLLAQAPRPTLVVVLGDRYEAFAVAHTAFLHQVPLLQLAAGDCTQGGCVDDTLRFALSQLAQFMGCFSEASHQRLLAQGVEPWRAFTCGSLANDGVLTAAPLSQQALVEAFPTELAGLDANKPWLLFTQHPVPHSPVVPTLQACVQGVAAYAAQHGYHVIATYPNEDLEGPAQRAYIEAYQKAHPQGPVFWVRHLGQQAYASALSHAAAVVGNSSSVVYESVLWRKPALCVGPRQQGREHAPNVHWVAATAAAVAEGLAVVLEDAAFATQVAQAVSPFGEGAAAPRISAFLAALTPQQLRQPKRYP